MGQLWKYVKGGTFFSQGMQKEYLYTKDKGLDFGADPPCIKLCRVPFPPVIFNQPYIKYSE